MANPTPVEGVLAAGSRPERVANLVKASVRVRAGDNQRANAIGDRVTGQYEDWSIPSRGCGEPQLTPSHRPSHSSPQPDPSPRYHQGLSRRR
jgi:hypothetical protein